MSDLWIIGQVARFSVALTDVNGATADPGALALKLKKPDGTVVTHNYGGGVCLKDGVGAYHADIALDASGPWAWRWESAAPNAGADENTLYVEKSFVL